MMTFTDLTPILAGWCCISVCPPAVRSSSAWSARGKVVRGRYPCWDRWGVTIAGPGGYRLVLSHRTWE
jgi:hypothetical protein